MSQEMLYLSAKEPVAAYSRPKWSFNDPPDALIQKGKIVPVYSCTSDKSDISLEVAISNRHFNVGPGDYKLVRRRATIREAWLNPQATFSCVGYLPGISVAGA
jgi:hypothetical protein